MNEPIVGEIAVRVESQAIAARPEDKGHKINVDVARATETCGFHDEAACVFEEIGDVKVKDGVGIDGAAWNRQAPTHNNRNIVRVDQKRARFSASGRLEGDFSDQLIDEDLVLAGKFDEAAVAALQATVGRNPPPKREGILSKENHVPTIALQGGISGDCSTFSDRDVDGILEIGILTAPASADLDLSAAEQAVRDHEGIRSQANCPTGNGNGASARDVRGGIKRAGDLDFTRRTGVDADVAALGF